MITTIVDYEILRDLMKRSPVNLQDGASFDDNFLFFRFLDFLKNGTNLKIVNYNETNPPELLLLLTARKNECKLTTDKSPFKQPHKFEININEYFKHLHFIVEDNEENQKRYVKKNPIPIGFKNNYLELYNKIDLHNKTLQIPIRENENTFSWSQVKDYLIDFSDVIIIDSYLLNHEDTYEANLYEIIRLINEKALEKDGPINILIVTADWEINKVTRERFKDFEGLFNKIKKTFIDIEVQKMRLGIVFLGEKEIPKEHDRTILFNFLRIKSGDSFTYFKQNKIDYATKGTEIDFFKQTRADYCNSYDSVKNAISEKINALKKKSSNRLQGNIENRLLVKKTSI